MPDSLRRNRDFHRLWAGQTISQLGSQVTFLALPLVAIRILDAGPLQVGILAACETLPFLLVGLPAGVWVDRWRRRPILVMADLGRAVVLATIPLAYALDVLTITQLYAVAVLVGVQTVFFDVAYQSYLPALVPRSRLTEGNARLELSRSASQVTGPGLGGLLVELFRAPYAVAVDSASFALSAVYLAGIRMEEPEPEPVAHEERGMRRSIAAGLRYVLGHPQLRRIAAATGISNLFSGVGMAVFLLYAVDRLGISPGVIGVVFSVGSLGIVASASVAERLGRAIGTGPTIILGAALAGLAFVLVPLAPEDVAVPLFVVSMLLETFGSSVYNITQVSLRQTVTPDRMQGRMNATMRFIVWGTLPLGSLVGGVLGKAIGLRPTLWVAAVGGTLCVVPVLGRPIRSLREMPADVNDETG